MAKKQSVAKLRKELDKVFSQYVRLKNANDNGMVECFTCGVQKHWKEIQAGHFMSRKHSATRWHEDNVKPQCVKCNMFGQGEQYIFGQNLGEDIAQQMQQLSRQTYKSNITDLREQISEYKDKVKYLLRWVC
jgi:Zn ribbon nucleic-acid-binding protein